MKGGKFHPFGKKNQTVHGKIIMQNEKGQEIGVTKMNFHLDSDKILEAKKMHIITEIEGQKVDEETIKLQ